MARVLFLIGQLSRGGTERQLSILARGLRQRGHETEVVCFGLTESGRASDYDMGDVPVRVTSRRFGRPAALLEAIAHARRFRPGIVQAFNFSLGFPAWLLARATGAAAIGAVRSDFLSEYEMTARPLRALCLRSPRLIVSNNAAAVPAILAAGPRVRVEVLPNALEMERFPETQRTRGASLQVVGVGSLVALKRWEWAIRAVAALRQDGLPIELTLYGEGPERPFLERLVATLGLAGVVRLPGLVQDVQAELARADVLVHTSSLEGSPNAVVEGMAAGLPVVAAICGDVARLIEDGKTGFLATDEPGFQTQLRRVSSQPELAMNVGAAARIYCNEHFRVEHILDRLLAIHASIVPDDASDA